MQLTTKPTTSILINTEVRSAFLGSYEDIFMNRKCNKCNFEGPLEFFIKQTRYKYGRRPLCKKCKAIDNKQIRLKKLGKKPLLDTPVQILISKGYALNEEEALKIINNF